MCLSHIVTRLGNGELYYSTLTKSAHTKNKRAMFVVSTKHLGTMFSKSLGGKSRMAGLSKTVIGDILKSLKSE